eukprot:TRINITY_DN3236_c0_g1_i1.p5 TRINITY_DN3236_c0_g1~~TRINITY_DN3236_c0_g1_i1.p5  ORF type:complete len:139 (+),score=8.92 TRINITY_DN3236_c0_g1_i1:446-862(+)
MMLVSEVKSSNSECPLGGNTGGFCPQKLPICQLGLGQELSQNQQELVHGKLGDCCEENTEEEHEHAKSGQNSESDTKYWGVVMQTKEMSSVEGCYLLKTSQSHAHDGCSCTHFHLTRVCKDVALEYQLRNSWLRSNQL